jgi:membrane protease YdiL (CAAX protease family)
MSISHAPRASSSSSSLGAEAVPVQYSLAKILGLWVTVSAPMAILAFVVVPAVRPHTSLHPGLIHWIAMVLGMAWQFVVSLWLLRTELGGLGWPAVAQRIRWQTPRNPRTNRADRRMWWWVIPAIGANLLGGYLANSVDQWWTRLFPGLAEPAYTHIQVLADSRFHGQWWILGLALTSLVFNYLLGEELFFHGVLLPSMRGVFGRWDWVANTVLFGLYHVHKIWFWPSMIASSFGYAWAAGRFRSLWLSVLVHGIEGFYIVLVFSVLAGWYP